jgi:hypothetical protein
MGAAVVLQDWITIQGLATTDIVIQSPDHWVDASQWSDAIFYTEVRDYAGSARLFLQTSPTADETLFEDMASISVAATGTTTSIIRFASASVPLSRYVRWKADATAANWRVVFRITAAFKNA